MKRCIAVLLLCVSVLLSGCNLPQVLSYAGRHLRGSYAFSDISYVRPDSVELKRIAEEGCRTARESDDPDAVMEQVWALYDLYDQIYSMYHLATIYYDRDLTDTHWQQEHAQCMDLVTEADAALDGLYRAIAASDCREALEKTYFGQDFFSGYEGDGLWDDAFLDYVNKDSELISRYYELSGQQADGFCTNADQALPLEELFVEMVALRQELAAYAGFDSFQEYAYQCTYYRDYSPEQAQELTEEIRQILVPTYVRLDSVWNEVLEDCSAEDAVDYVRRSADAMGGIIQEAFDTMETDGLWDIGWQENRYDGSFEVYLPSFQTPFVFVSTYGDVEDCLTVSHEFGHFCMDYASYGSTVSTDVAEVFSQGMEYLSLCYGEPSEQAYRMKIEDSLCTYVEQSAYAAFEQQVYDLTEDDLTVENVEELFADICRQYGMEAEEGWQYVNIPHFFTSPMYIISYVVSNDVAFQLYELEMNQPGQGLEVFSEHLDTEAETISQLVEQTGLESPFGPGRIAAAAESICNILG